MTRTIGWLLSGILLIVTANPSAAQARGGNKNDVAAPTGITFSYTMSVLTITWSPASGAARYAVVRRQGTAQQELGQITTTSFSGPLPTRGVGYEYQVVSIGKLAQAPSAWIPYTVPEIQVLGVIAPTIVGTITPYVLPAGPARLSANSTVTGQCSLNWSQVADAARYEVTRSTATSAESLTGGIGAGSQLPESGYFYTNYVGLTATYQYKVYAVLTNGVRTAQSPSAFCTSIPVVHVTGLRADKKGAGRVQVSWSAVPGVIYYWIDGAVDSYVQSGLYPESRQSGTSFQTIALPNGSYRWCVITVFQGATDRIAEPGKAPCVQLTLP